MDERYKKTVEVVCLLSPIGIIDCGRIMQRGSLKRGTVVSTWGDTGAATGSARNSQKHAVEHEDQDI